MCKEEVLLLFEQIQDSLDTIITRAIPVNTADDFTHSPDGMMRLDSICMLLVTIGEAIKNIDKYTHKYFNVDAEIILRIVKINVPQLQKVIEQIIIELKKEALEDI